MTPPASNEAEDDRFLLTRREDIKAVLRQLGRRPELVTMHFNHGRESLVTAVLGVDDENGEVELDQGPDAAVNRRAQDASGIVCLASEHNVSVRFRLSGIRAVERADGPAFRAPLPESVHRLQRREYFRVPMPVARPVLCHIPGPDGTVHALRCADLSLGGAGIIDSAMKLGLAVGDRFPGCELEIPAVGTIPVTVQVRNISRHISRDGTAGRRVGLALDDISPRASTQLQRYLQRMQIALRDAGRDD